MHGAGRHGYIAVMTAHGNEDGTTPAEKVHTEGLADSSDDPQTRPAPGAEEPFYDAIVRENAETALDQPSESVE